MVIITRNRAHLLLKMELFIDEVEESTRHKWVNYVTAPSDLEFSSLKRVPVTAPTYFIIYAQRGKKLLCDLRTLTVQITVYIRAICSGQSLLADINYRSHWSVSGQRFRCFRHASDLAIGLSFGYRIID